MHDLPLCAAGDWPAIGAMPLEHVAQRRLGAALEAVHAAMSVCRRVQQRSAAGPRAKDDSSPVTIADYASQAVVVQRLQDALGPVTLVAEEDSAFMSRLGDRYLEAVVGVVREVWPDATARAVTDAIAVGAATPAERGFWTLDPVDGTKGFLRNEQYAVALAYVECGRPTLAVLGCPRLARDPLEDAATARDEGIICFAVEGHGAFELPARSLAAAPRRLSAASSPVAETVRVCVSFERAHGNGSGLARVVEQSGLRCRTLCLDSQGKYAVVARGQAEVYLRVPSSPAYKELIWDHAAGSLIASEAGCRVTDLAGRPLDFNVGRRLVANRGVLCARPEWHGALLEALLASGVETGTPAGTAGAC